MIFNKYSSIENSCRKKEVDRVIQSGHLDKKWVVLEKIHGSNLQIFTDGKEVKFAKRSSFINQSEENFNGLNNIAEKLTEQALRVFYFVNDLIDGVEYVSICGEIYGGSYNHKDVPRMPNQVRINKGVFYKPVNDFYAFDIKINGGYYLSYRIALDIFEQVNKLTYAKPLMYGNFKECLEYNENFITTLPEQFNLPPIKDNFAEGIVIKPVD